MLSDHVNMNLKRGVKILTCDPEKRLIEAETRNGEVISVNAYYYNPTFRWPIPEEKWVVKEENGSWYLDGIYEPQGIPGETIQAKPGDAIISSSSGNVYKNVNGKLEPLVEVPTTLGVKDYIEDEAAKGRSLGTYTLKERSYSRFVLATFNILWVSIESFRTAEIIVKGKSIAKTQRSGSEGTNYKTTLTVVVPPNTSCIAQGGSTNDVTLTEIWESIP